MNIKISSLPISLITALLLAAASLMAIAPITRVHAEAVASFEDKAVYHVDDPSVAAMALRNIVNHLNASPGVKISLVANGKGITMLAADEYFPQIAELQRRGVRFVACNNSMKGFGIEASKLVPGAVIVPAGVAELSRLQVVEHYAYIKP